VKDKKSDSKTKKETKKEVSSKTTESKRGRPKKQRSPEELSKIAAQKKSKLTLAEKQAIKLKLQREKEAAKAARGEVRNQDRDYVKNEDLKAELIKWKNSAKEPEKRVLSEEFGEMLLKIGRKLLNHSNFRNYDPELKADMCMFGIQKIIKGLKNYNFEFSNPFAWISMSFWNSYLTVIYRHYKQLNIKRDLMKKLSMELETYSGIDPRSSLNKAIKEYLGSDIELD